MRANRDPDWTVRTFLVITHTAPGAPKGIPTCPLHQQEVSVRDEGTLTSPVDTIKGEVKFAWLELGLGWVGEGATCPLNHCLSWSKALSPPLVQRTCGAGGTTQHHAFIPTGAQDGLLASTRWVQGWTLRCKVSPGSGVLGKSQSSTKGPGV